MFQKKKMAKALVVKGCHLENEQMFCVEDSLSIVNKNKQSLASEVSRALGIGVEMQIVVRTCSIDLAPNHFKANLLGHISKKWQGRSSGELLFHPGNN